ncbi:MAG: hypothetical protein JWR77_1822 [Rhizorhabdus sp.]|nr:hypothetical protein [Rhizorhabdus sp.]
MRLQIGGVRLHAAGPFALLSSVMTIVAIDFEASCLPRHGRSFPIEVGIAGDGLSSRSWLIRPHADWAGWTWTATAEAVHGLSLDRLYRDGLPAEAVAADLIEAIGDRRLIADSLLDGIWMETLMGVAGMATPPIAHVRELFEELDARDADIVIAQAAMAARPFRRHCAGEDARWLAAMIAEVEAAARQRQRTTGVPIFVWEARAPAWVAV